MDSMMWVYIFFMLIGFIAIGLFIRTQRKMWKEQVEINKSLLELRKR